MKRLVYNNLSNGVSNTLSKVNYRENRLAVRQFPYEIEIAAENLVVPWAMALSDEGKLYVTERPGSIRVIEDSILRPEPLITFHIPFVSQGEGGLMGIALDPNHSQNGFIYVMYTYAEGNQRYNRVARLIENNNRATIERIILDKIPGGQIHNGGRLKIGPDQKLYITTGDAGKPELAQDPTSLAGKILRIELDGSIPKDNPISNSLVYSFGHRNPQGLAWNTENILYASEHGSRAHDEINRIQSGGNYGWPLVQGDEGLEAVNVQKPLIHSGENTWAPAGMTFVSQGPWQNQLLVAALRGEELLAISLNEEGTQVEALDVWFQNEYGRLRDVLEAKDGAIYLATSNRDGRGNAAVTDDKIIRLIPRESNS